jgi:hypothetical protein
VLPTGAGKTVVFSALIKQFRERHYDTPLQHTGLRVIVLVHRDELADQAMAKIHATAPHLTVGKVKAETRQVDADVMVCSVQTLARGKALLQIRAAEQTHRSGPVGLIITDECHHAAALSYRKVYDAFPDALQLGVTATMARGDGVGLGSTWEEVVYSRSILWMMSKGFLAPVRAVKVELTSLDMGGVKTSRGDYSAGDLGRAMMEAEAEKAIPRAYQEHAKGRQGIVFTPTVATAEATCDAMNDAGIPSAVVSGETPKSDRHRIYDSFRRGAVQVLVNCMVLTEGFDAPWAEVAVIARPTQSAPLYIQMVGRVLRPWAGKKDALVLDLVWASSNRVKTLIDLEPGLIKGIQPGETLEEAVEREAEASPNGSIAFGLKHKDVDMFAASDKTWLRTDAGIPFIPAGMSTVFLFKSLTDPSLMDVVTFSPGDVHPVRHPEHRDMDMSSALAWGEVVAEDLSIVPVSKSSAWRMGEATASQRRTAARLGIKSRNKKCGELVDAIYVATTSAALDRYSEWA